MGRVGRARREVDEERTIGGHRLLLLDEVDGLVGQPVVEGVVALAPARHLHLHRLVADVERRLPLVGLAPMKPKK